jgi:hypothetical protein
MEMHKRNQIREGKERREGEGVEKAMASYQK